MSVGMDQQVVNVNENIFVILIELVPSTSGSLLGILVNPSVR
jgi:hypothetical protein